MPRIVSILLSALGVVVCGTIGGVAAWALVASMGLDGIAGSLVAAVLGMAIAVGAWIVGTTLADRIGARR